MRSSSFYFFIFIVATISATSADVSHDQQLDPPRVEQTRDEFNTSSTFKRSLFGSSKPAQEVGAQQHLSSLKLTLLRINYTDCCPSWSNLTQNQEIHDELKRKHKAKHNQPATLKLADLLDELQRTFDNITNLSIDGQSGPNEAEKYYQFYDDVEYYLKLIKISHSLLSFTPLKDKNDSHTKSKPNKHLEYQQELNLKLNSDFKERTFRRQLKTIEFKVARDPILSNFLRELMLTSHESQQQMTTNKTELNESFRYYENFIRFTKFGQYYARNISLARELSQEFNQICDHLMRLEFPSNLTRPSKQYEMIRRMSYELFYIKNELLNKISSNVLNNHQDVREILTRLDQFIQLRPEIRMLGDEFSQDAVGFSSNVRQLTNLLDLYLNNNLTEVSFYDQLSGMPEEFILLGSSIAREYEIRERPQFSRFDGDYFNWQQMSSNQGRYGLSGKANDQTNSSSSSSPSAADARHSSQSIFSKLFH